MPRSALRQPALSLANGRTPTSWTPLRIDRYAFHDDAAIPAIAADAAAILAAVRKHGAVVLEQAVAGAQEFDRLVGSLLPPCVTAVTTSSPRRRVGTNTFTSTEFSSLRAIPLHQELVYHRRWPEFCAFMCLEPADAGGETTLGSVAEISALLPQDLLAEFHRREVRYVQRFGDGYTPDWRSAFQVDAIDEALAVAAERGMEAHRTEHGLDVAYTAQGALQAADGTLLWANQAHLYHIAALGAEAAAALGTENAPRHAYFGDGGTIPNDAITCVNEALHAAEYRHEWKRGDVILIDNSLVMHGRRPFEGSRSVLAAFAGIRTGADAPFHYPNARSAGAEV